MFPVALFLPEVCLGQRVNPLNVGNDPDYDPDPAHNHCEEGLQSLTDCLVLT